MASVRVWCYGLVIFFCLDLVGCHLGLEEMTRLNEPLVFFSFETRYLYFFTFFFLFLGGKGQAIDPSP